jgi:hypothetical protein
MSSQRETWLCVLQEAERKEAAVLITIGVGRQDGGGG